MTTPGPPEFISQFPLAATLTGAEIFLADQLQNGNFVTRGILGTQILAYISAAIAQAPLASVSATLGTSQDSYLAPGSTPGVTNRFLIIGRT
jgi:hypothetical protein